MLEQELLHAQSPLEELLRREQVVQPEGSWEHLVYDQWLKLPKTLAALEEKHSLEELQNSSNESNGLRRAAPMPLYRHLALLAVQYGSLREDFFEEIREKQTANAKVLRFKIQTGEINKDPKKVVIVGAGPNGLTVARELLAKTDAQRKMVYKPEDIVVVEKRNTVGGQFTSKDVLEYTLNVDPEIQGQHVIIQPADILGKNALPQKSLYADMVAANAYFSNVQVALETSWSDNDEKKSMIVPSDSSSTDPSRIFINEGDSTIHDIVTDAIAFAPGLGEGAYGQYTYNRHLSFHKHKDDEGYNILNPDEMYKELFEIGSDLQSHDRVKRQQATKRFIDLLHGRIAIAGAKNTAALYISQMMFLYEAIRKNLDPEEVHSLEKSVYIYPGSWDTAELHKRLEDSARIFGVSIEEARKIFVFRPGYLHIHTAEGDSKGQMRIVDDGSDRLNMTFQTVAFTGYEPISFLKLFWDIYKTNGKAVGMLESEFNKTRRLKGSIFKPGWRVFFAGPLLEEDRVPHKENGNLPYERGRLVRDGIRAVGIADKIYKSQKGRLFA